MKLPLRLHDDGIHYNNKKCMSYGCYMNISVGGRGIGKTTNWLLTGLSQQNNGGQFLYVRRYKPELKEFVNKRSLDNLLDGVIYKGSGTGGYEFWYEDNLLGYGDIMTNSLKLKSVDLSKVSLIIFDEATLIRGGSYKYLKDEVTILLELISTVERTRPKGSVKIVLLGNNTDIFNPYYEYFQIPYFKDRYVDIKRGLYVEECKPSEALLELEKKTGLYALTEGTSYSDYHYGNEVLVSKKACIITKPDDARLFCRIGMNEYTLNMYHYNGDEGLSMYCEFRNKTINDNITYRILNNNRPNYIIADIFRKKMRGYIGRFYYDDRMAFSNPKASEIFSMVMDLIRG